MKEINWGSCPCKTISNRYWTISAHCWRSCLECAFSGVHVERYAKGYKKNAVAAAIKLAGEISETWSTACEAVPTKRK